MLTPVVLLIVMFDKYKYDCILKTGLIYKKTSNRKGDYMQDYILVTKAVATGRVYMTTYFQPDNEKAFLEAERLCSTQTDNEVVFIGRVEELTLDFKRYVDKNDFPYQYRQLVQRYNELENKEEGGLGILADAVLLGEQFPNESLIIHFVNFLKGRLRMHM